MFIPIHAGGAFDKIPLKVKTNKQKNSQEARNRGSSST